MSHTLIIYEIAPEQTKMDLIPNEVADQYVGLLDQAHNKYITSDDTNPGLEFLNLALSKQNEWDGSNAEGIFVNYKIDTRTPLKDVLITRVYLTG